MPQVADEGGAMPFIRDVRIDGGDARTQLMWWSSADVGLVEIVRAEIDSEWNCLRRSSENPLVIQMFEIAVWCQTQKGISPNRVLIGFNIVKTISRPVPGRMRARQGPGVSNRRSLAAPLVH